MGAVKAWKMDMDENIADAILNGAATENAVVSYVGTMLPIIDKDYIKQQYTSMFGEEDDSN